jgi:hypothetical protein
MSQLHYLSLPDVDRWDFVLGSVGWQVSPYHKYFSTALHAATKQHPTLAWRTAARDEVADLERRRTEREARRWHRDSVNRRDRPQQKGRAEGFWIVLEAPPSQPEVPNATFDAFLDATEVHDGANPTYRGPTSIAVLDRDFEARALLLKHLPTPVEPPKDRTKEVPFGPLLWLTVNTHSLKSQQRALRALENTPTPRIAPLVKLFATRANWPPVVPQPLAESDWVFLRAQAPSSAMRDGTNEQRRFVSIALATPDFAILEGPPGSGKSTAICELIVQSVRAGKRVLLVASTHVAVDNVLERLLAWQSSAAEKPVLPVRIGEEHSVTSELLQPFTYKRMLKTWSHDLQDFLERPSNVSPDGDAARKTLFDALCGNKPDELALPRLLLDSSNLVCGTTIGILQHPSIKGRWSAQANSEGLELPGESMAPFDLMILDEASKTTLTEFLVPAMHAARWVVVGDIRQLSPYVEEQQLRDNIASLCVDDTLTLATTCSFLATRGKQVRSLVAVENAADRATFARVAGEIGANWLDTTTCELSDKPNFALLTSDVVFGSADSIKKLAERLPADFGAVFGPLPELETWRAQRSALVGDADAEVSWAEQLAWRLTRSFELRENPEERKKLDDDVRALIPSAQSKDAAERVQQNLQAIRRVALPSILELLQRGFERMEGSREPVVLSDGLPRGNLAQRLVSLSFQHRMHPEISVFPREEFYRTDDATRTLLKDSRTLATDRAWTWTRFAKRAQWISVAPNHRQRDFRTDGKNSNLAEAKCVIEELKAFREWVENGNSRRDSAGRPVAWEVAVLTFYAGQETLLRKMLQKHCNQFANTRNFTVGSDLAHPSIRIVLCTVDSFQGHEADVVFLSFVQTHKVGFLNSPNRLNVALTRARYQLVLIGNRNWFAQGRHHSDLLRRLATSDHVPQGFAWEVSK